VNPSTCSPDRLKRLRELCLSFPETDERLDHGDPKWTINGKGFATQKGNYDGGRPSVWFKPTPADHKALPNSYPDKFFVPPYTGSKGWLAMYLDRPGLDWAEVTELIEDSYRQMAPKRALKVLDERST
jgi:predicted DNA-binding protein (MmcQ/YjbR family)